MDNLQRSEIDSFNRVDDVVTQNESALDPIPEFIPLKTTFRASLQSAKDAGVAQTHLGIDQAMSLEVKTKMAKTLVKYCLRAGVKARALNNAELAKQLDGSDISIINATKAKAIELATNRRKALADNLTVLTNISQADIDEIDAAIAAFNTIKDSPTLVLQTKKATATDPLPGFIATTHDAVAGMYDLILSYFFDTNPELVKKFEEAMQVIVTGKHSTSITFDCLADEDASQLRSFTVMDVSKNKKFLPNDEGLINIEHHRSGKFHFTISAATRIDVDFTATIKRGTSNHFTVRLKKA
jgi:hypothetical protein